MYDRDAREVVCLQPSFPAAATPHALDATAFARAAAPAREIMAMELLIVCPCRRSRHHLLTEHRKRETRSESEKGGVKWNPVGECGGG